MSGYRTTGGATHRENRASDNGPGDDGDDDDDDDDDPRRPLGGYGVPTDDRGETKDDRSVTSDSIDSEVQINNIQEMMDELQQVLQEALDAGASTDDVADLINEIDNQQQQLAVLQHARDARIFAANQLLISEDVFAELEEANRQFEARRKAAEEKAERERLEQERIEQ